MIPSLATRVVMALALFALSLSTQAACTIDDWAASKGAVAAVPEANYYGDCGLRVDLDGQSAYVEGAAYVEDQTPGNVSPPVTEYAARFYVDASNAMKFDNVLMRSGGEYRVQLVTFSANKLQVESGAVFSVNTAAKF